MTIPGFITARQAAKEARTSVDTIRRACRNKDITGVIQIGRSFLIPRAAFDKWKSTPRKRGPKPNVK